MTPVEFYTARLDELEAVARSGLRLRRGVEHFEKRQGVPGRLAQYRTHPDVPWRWLTPEAEAELFEPVEPDPYILADIAAKRAVIAEHHSFGVEDDGTLDPYASAGDEEWCAGCGFNGVEEYRRRMVECPTIRALIQPFATHPDFEEIWKL